jgi:hypothetical protein
VFTTDKRFEAAGDTWSPPAERPLAEGGEVQARLEPESVSITTTRPGHPLLVKISYHPRWRATGADGPYLVSPGLMMIVPRQAEVRLAYAARTWSDRLGRTLGLATLALALALAARRRAGRPAARATVGLPPPERPGPRARPLGARALRVLPLVLLAALAMLRLAPDRPRDVEMTWLDEHAARAYAEDRWEDAAEYARHALDRTPAADTRRGEFACLRGEALLRAGHPRLAAEAFGLVVDAGAGPYRPQALYSGALAREAAGDASGAAVWRSRLRADYPETPWAKRLQKSR